MCRYERGWTYSRTSPWCAIFTKDDIKIFEFWEDLAQYHEAALGHPLTKKLGCTTLKEVQEQFT